ncbi:hypothetical protein JCM1841_001907 [Sporobolomyces salmonicolor]
MQSDSPYDQSSDISAFNFGLDTPAKFFTGGSNSPNLWSLGAGLTPSLFASLGGGAPGFTPSIAAGQASTTELNPFEFSLSGSADKARRSSLTGPHDGTDPSSEVDHFSSIGGLSGRKRALSSPAIHTPGGSIFPFLAEHQPEPSSTLPDLALQPSKRPRISISATSACSNESLGRRFSGSERDSDQSPASSVVPTPTDSTGPIPLGDFVKDSTLLPIPEDIDVLGSSTSPSAIPVSAPLREPSLFDQLAQQHSALLASGSASFSQAPPLPIKALVTPVKPEPVDERPVPVPPLTRSASKKGKVPAPPPFYTASSSTSASPASNVSTAPKGKRGRKKATPAATLKKAGEEDGDEDEETVKRKQFLERNRVAACKSRQKKKEKVGALEQVAADLCHKNHILQQSAFALRQEIITLRQLIQAHNGCSCEHAQGYIERDRSGRGLALLDHLAGRTMHLDYTLPPAMGSEDDVYADFDPHARTSDVDEPLRNRIARPTAGSMNPLPSGKAGPGIPILSNEEYGRLESETPVPDPSSTFEDSVRSQAAPALQMPNRSSHIFTRSAVSTAGPSIPVRGGSLAHGHSASFDFGSTPRAFDFSFGPSTTMAPLPTLDAMAQGLLDIPVRPGSAPPTTPSWNDTGGCGAGEHEDYFSVPSGLGEVVP